MSIQVSYKKQAIFGTMFLLILLFVIEMISQVIWYEIETKCELPKYYYDGYENDFLLELCNDYRNFQYLNDNEIRLNLPNQQGVSYSINEYGFRGDSFSMEKKDDEFRIIMVGGSTTFGLGSTSNESTIPNQLEKILENKFQKDFLVINAGVIAAKSTDEVFNIKHNLLSYNPDMIIVFDGYNDAFNIRLDEISEGDTFSGNRDKTTLESLIKKYIGNFATPNIIYQYTADYLKISSLTDQIKEKNTENWIKRWNEICSISKEKDFELLVTIQPMLGTGDREMTDKELEISKKITHVKTLEFLNDLGDNLELLECPYADLRNTFDNNNEQIFFSLVHTGDEQNNILAERISKEVSTIMSNLIS